MTKHVRNYTVVLFCGAGGVCVCGTLTYEGLFRDDVLCHLKESAKTDMVNNDGICYLNDWKNKM